MKLESLLDSGKHFEPEYNGGLSNHLPMVLTALHGLGASHGRQVQFFNQYSPRLERAPSHELRNHPLPENEWELCGRTDTYHQLQGHFEAAIKREGIDVTLRRSLPYLMPGCGAAAWHGLLRTTYALISTHDGELASGLAYWTSRHLDLGSTSCSGTTNDVPGTLLSLKSHMLDWHSDHGLIYLRMQSVATNKNFSEEIAKLRIEKDTLAVLAEYALELYLRTRDFVVLHLVTSCHAMRLILPFCDNPIEAMHHYWKSFAAGVIASGIELEQKRLPIPASGTWQDAMEIARRSDDDHLIKMVFTLSRENDHYQDIRYLQAALLATSN